MAKQARERKAPKKERPASNYTVDPGTFDKFVQRILEVEGDRRKLHSEYMLDCKSVAEDRREILKQAKNEGIDPKLVRFEVEDRIYQAGRNEFIASLSPDLQRIWREIQPLIGTFPGEDENQLRERWTREGVPTEEQERRLAESEAEFQAAVRRGEFSPNKKAPEALGP
jgi:hypothetical protein